MVRLRIQFQKIGRIRFTSHRDLLRIFQRSFAAAHLPMSYSKGFHPHPRVSLGPPLKTGWGGMQEYMDIYLTEAVSGAGERVNRFLPGGLAVTETSTVNDKVPKLAKDICAARYAIEVDAEELFTRWGNGCSGRDVDSPRQASAGGLWKSKDNLHELENAIRNHFGSTGRHSHNGDPQLIELSASRRGEYAVLDYMCTMPSGKSLTAADLLSPFAGEAEEFKILPKVVRKALYVERNGEFLSPIHKGVVRDLS
jgi:hypothetical protein